MCLARERGADKSLEEEKWTCPRIKNARRSILAENKARLSEQQQQEEEERVCVCVWMHNTADEDWASVRGCQREARQRLWAATLRFTDVL